MRNDCAHSKTVNWLSSKLGIVTEWPLSIVNLNSLQSLDKIRNGYFDNLFVWIRFSRSTMQPSDWLSPNLIHVTCCSLVIEYPYTLEKGNLTKWNIISSGIKPCCSASHIARVEMLWKCKQTSNRIWNPKSTMQLFHPCREPSTGHIRCGQNGTKKPGLNDY